MSRLRNQDAVDLCRGSVGGNQASQTTLWEGRLRVPMPEDMQERLAPRHVGEFEKVAAAIRSFHS